MNPGHPWAVLVWRADSQNSLNHVMDDWYETVKSGGRLQSPMGFDSYTKRRDWDSARHFVKRTYGRSSAEHHDVLDTLNAAIQD